MRERIDLYREVDLELLHAPQLDDPVENLLPIAISGEIVITDKERFNALRMVPAD
jgi:hypothetical protein